MTPLHLKTPLPEEKQAVLIIMDRVARQANLRYLVVGATARDILMYHLHGFPLNRASPDIDFAIAVESWSAFDGLRAALLQGRPFGRTRRSRIGFTIRQLLARVFRSIWFRSAVSKLLPRKWRGLRIWRSR